MGGNPINFFDADGLAKSERMTKVPGTNNIVGGDPPHGPGQQAHVHIYDKNGNLIIVINKDGTGSHGMCRNDLPKNKKLMSYLLGKGFILGAFGDLLFFRELTNQVGKIVDPSNPFFDPPPRDPFDPLNGGV